MLERVLDVENRAQVRAHPLTVLDANGLVGCLDDHGSFGIALERAVDHDAQHPAARLPPELDVEDIEAKRSGDPLGRCPDALQARIGCHSRRDGNP